MNRSGKAFLVLWLAFAPPGAVAGAAGSEEEFIRALNADESLILSRTGDLSAFSRPLSGPAGLGPLPAPIYGVTVDRLDDLSAAIGSLRAIARKPTARLVFNAHARPAEYRDAVAGIHAASYIMGELLDSYFVKDCGVEEYERRAVDYFDAFGGQVDLWEVGNEVNGDWLGETADVAAKMTAAYKAIKGRGGRTALTLHYSSAYADDPEHEPFRWAQANVPEEMKKGLDYVLISYYEVDSPGPPPDWNEVFSRLARMFPNAQVGFGEAGTEDPSLKREVLRRCYGLRVDEPRYIGGCFWWFFSQDMVPSTRPLLKDLNDVIVSPSPALTPKE